MAVGGNRLGRALWEALAAFLGLGSSFLGWIPELTGLPAGWFLIGLGVVSLVLGWWIAAEEAVT